MEKLKIFLDCDDTLIDSSECIIEILNSKYGLNKKIDDLKDFEFKSIYKEMNSDKVFNLFESDDFWNSIKVKDGFNIDYFKRKNLKPVVVSCGTKNNLNKKQKFIEDNFGFKFIGLEFTPEDFSLNKSGIDMAGGIQIDDNYSSLEGTNAAIKILIQNNRRFEWSIPKAGEDNLYVVQDWNDIYKILDFVIKYPEFIERCY